MEDINILKEKAKEVAMENRAKFGKASENAVFGKLMGEVKRSNLPYSVEEVKKIAKEACEEVNSIKDFNSVPARKENKPKEKEYSFKSLLANLKDLDDVKGKVITRFEPSPSGPLHIGHLLPLVLNFAYAKKYDGEFILRIGDTNPQNILPEAYDMIVEDVEWTTSTSIKDMRYEVQSERLPLYYEIAEELIKKGVAYVCTCKPDKFKELVSKGKPCPHREQSVEKNLEEWEKMFKEYKDGEAVLRIKTDIKHDNPAVRDWPAFRILSTPHPLHGDKYRVWPLMNFSVAVDDHLMGITHVIRGKDHIVNAERQAYLFGYMGWELPSYIHIGKVNFTDLKLSTTKVKEEIAKGKYEGWDDVRLPFLRAFRKRGYKPEALMYYILEMGLSLRDKKTTLQEFMKTINKINRVLIDKEANRYFFISNDKKVKLIGLDKDVVVKLPLHPEDERRGERILIIKKQNPYVFIEKKDYEIIKEGEFVRLKHFALTKRTKEGLEIINFSSSQTTKAKVIHYLPYPKEENIPTKVIMPDGKIIEGMAERNIAQEEEGKRLQFERFGFVKVDKMDKLYKCISTYYIHE